MKITKCIASKITLYDDETPYGGKSYADEKLDNFMEECGIPFGTSLKKVNQSLVECGIKPIPENVALNASSPLTSDQCDVLDKIARRSKMDCWFGTDEYGRVHDYEKEGRGTLVDPKIGVGQLIDGMTSEDFHSLTEDEKFTLIKGMANIMLW